MLIHWQRDFDNCILINGDENIEKTFKGNFWKVNWARDNSLSKIIIHNRLINYMQLTVFDIK